MFAKIRRTLGLAASRLQQNALSERMGLEGAKWGRWWWAKPPFSFWKQANNDLKLLMEKSQPEIVKRDDGYPRHCTERGKGEGLVHSLTEDLRDAICLALTPKGSAV